MSEESEPLTLPGSMWHVTLTVNGRPVTNALLEESLSALTMAHPFGLSARYANDTAELRYWTEGQDCAAVVASACQLWSDTGSALGLPDWPIVGLEVLDRITFRRRWPSGHTNAHLLDPGVKPFTPGLPEPE